MKYRALCDGAQGFLLPLGYLPGTGSLGVVHVLGTDNHPLQSGDPYTQIIQPYVPGVTSGKPKWVQFDALGESRLTPAATA